MCAIIKSPSDTGCHIINKTDFMEIEMADSSLRLLILLKHLPREPAFISSQTLHQRMQDEGYSVSLRTIQRDLSALSLHFPLIQNQPSGIGKTGLGWAFARDSQNISFPVMGSAAALTFSMAMRHLQQLLPVSALAYLKPIQNEAENQLNKHNSSRYQSWLDKVRITPLHFLQPPQTDGDVVALIYQALLESRQFKASYKGVPERIIHPYGLVQQGHTLYLVCRFYEFDDIRITALHRFASVQLLDENVRPFPEFEIDDYLGKGAMQWLMPEKSNIFLELRINENLAYYLEETPIAEGQQIEQDASQDDSYFLRANLQDSQQLRYWLLSQADQLEILGPVEMREWITGVASHQAKLYL